MDETYYVRKGKKILWKRMVYRNQNQDKIRKYNQEYYQANKEKFKARARERAELYPDTVRLAQAKYRGSNKRRVKEVQKMYRKNHPDRVKESNHKYYLKNKEKLIEAQRRRRAAEKALR